MPSACGFTRDLQLACHRRGCRLLFLGLEYSNGQPDNSYFLFWKGRMQLQLTYGVTPQTNRAVINDFKNGIKVSDLPEVFLKYGSG